MSLDSHTLRVLEFGKVIEDCGHANRIYSYGGTYLYEAIAHQRLREYDEALEDYATNKSAEHVPAWGEFNKLVGSKGDVGIWHETYVVKPGTFECVYNNMPRFGLSRAFDTIPAVGAYARAQSRMAEQAREKREAA